MTVENGGTLMPPEEPPLPSAKQVKDDLTFGHRDRDDDRGLTEGEFERSRGVVERLKDPDKFARYDTDGDGRVNRAEWSAGRAADREAQGGPPPTRG